MSIPTQATDDLRALRRAAGLSQQELAERARCSFSSVRLMESGYRPSGGRSAVLERVLAVLLNDVRPGVGPEPRGDYLAARGGHDVESYASP